MKILLTGAAGQPGKALIDAAPAGMELLASSRNDGEGLLALDLADATSCRQAPSMELPHAPLQKRSGSMEAKCCKSAPISSSTASRDALTEWIRAAIPWGHETRNSAFTSLLTETARNKIKA